MDKNFWRDKKVFVTGHTGFKGAWLTFILNLFGAKVTGYALKPPTNPNLFSLIDGDKISNSIIGDIKIISGKFGIDYGQKFLAR